DGTGTLLDGLARNGGRRHEHVPWRYCLVMLFIVHLLSRLKRRAISCYFQTEAASDRLVCGSHRSAAWKHVSFEGPIGLGSRVDDFHEAERGLERPEGAMVKRAEVVALHQLEVRVPDEALKSVALDHDATDFAVGSQINLLHGNCLGL